MRSRQALGRMLMVAALLFVAACGGRPRQGAPLDPKMNQDAPAETKPGGSREDGPKEGDAKEGKQPATAAPASTAPAATAPAATAKAATGPAAGANASAPEAPAVSLAVAAGLDSTLRRRIAAWDREVEAGLIQQARIRMRGREFMEAEALRLQNLDRADKASLVDLYLLGRMLGKLGQVEEAQAVFMKALARDSEFLFAHEGLALCERYSGNPESVAAIRVHLDRAFRIWPDFPRGLLVLAQIQLEEGSVTGQLDPRKALAIFQRIPRDHPAYEDALIGICDCHQALRQYDAAIVKLRAALEKQPERAQWWVKMAQAQAAAGKREEAEATLKTVLRTEPEHPTALFYLARLLVEREQLDEASRLFVRVAENRANPIRLRQAAVLQLRRMGTRRPAPPTAGELLATLENDPDPARRREAASLLYARMQQELSRRVEDKLLKDANLMRVFTSKLSVKREPDEGVRVLAVRVVSFRFHEPELKLLAKLLNPEVEPSKLVRGVAASQLGRVVLRYAPLAELILALEDPEPYVFRQARVALRTTTKEQFHSELRGELTAEERAKVVAAWQAWYGKRQASRKADGLRPAKRG